MIDTGFTGHVAIPKDVLNGDLGFPDLYLTWRMADGSQVNALAYQGVVTVVSLASFPVLIVVLGSDYMIGRGVIDHLKTH